jgi:hypothetical protein
MLFKDVADSVVFAKCIASTINLLMDDCPKSYVDFIGDEGLLTHHYAFKKNYIKSYSWSDNLNSSYIWRN